MSKNKELIRKLYTLWTYYPHVTLGKLIDIIGNGKPITYNTDEMLLSKIEGKLSFCSKTCEKLGDQNNIKENLNG